MDLHQAWPVTHTENVSPNSIWPGGPENVSPNSIWPSGPENVSPNTIWPSGPIAFSGNNNVLLNSPRINHRGSTNHPSQTNLATANVASNQNQNSLLHGGTSSHIINLNTGVSTSSSSFSTVGRIDTQLNDVNHRQPRPFLSQPVRNGASMNSLTDIIGSSTGRPLTSLTMDIDSTATFNTNHQLQSTTTLAGPDVTTNEHVIASNTATVSSNTAHITPGTTSTTFTTNSNTVITRLPTNRRSKPSWPTASNLAPVGGNVRPEIMFHRVDRRNHDRNSNRNIFNRVNNSPNSNRENIGNRDIQDLNNRNVGNRNPQNLNNGNEHHRNSQNLNNRIDGTNVATNNENTFNSNDRLHDRFLGQTNSDSSNRNFGNRNIGSGSRRQNQHLLITTNERTQFDRNSDNRHLANDLFSSDRFSQTTDNEDQRVNSHQLVFQRVPNAPDNSLSTNRISTGSGFNRISDSNPSAFQDENNKRTGNQNRHYWITPDNINAASEDDRYMWITTTDVVNNPVDTLSSNVRPNIRPHGGEETIRFPPSTNFPPQNERDPFSHNRFKPRNDVSGNNENDGINDIGNIITRNGIVNVNRHSGQSNFGVPLPNTPGHNQANIDSNRLNFGQTRALPNTPDHNQDNIDSNRLNFGQTRPLQNTPGHNQDNIGSNRLNFGQTRPLPNTPGHNEDNIDSNRLNLEQTRPLPNTPGHNQGNVDNNRLNFGQIRPLPNTPGHNQDNISSNRLNFGQTRPLQNIPGHNRDNTDSNRLNTHGPFRVNINSGSIDREDNINNYGSGGTYVNNADNRGNINDNFKRVRPTTSTGDNCNNNTLNINSLHDSNANEVDHRNEMGRYNSLLFEPNFPNIMYDLPGGGRRRNRTQNVNQITRPQVTTPTVDNFRPGLNRPGLSTPRPLNEYLPPSANSIQNQGSNRPFSNHGSSFISNQNVNDNLNSLWPSTVRPVSVTPSTVRPVSARPGSSRPSSVRPGSVRPGSARPGGGRPSSARPSTPRPVRPVRPSSVDNFIGSRPTNQNYNPVTNRPINANDNHGAYQSTVFHNQGGTTIQSSPQVFQDHYKPISNCINDRDCLTAETNQNQPGSSVSNSGGLFGDSSAGSFGSASGSPTSSGDSFGGFGGSASQSGGSFGGFGGSASQSGGSFGGFGGSASQSGGSPSNSGGSIGGYGGSPSNSGGSIGGFSGNSFGSAGSSGSGGDANADSFNTHINNHFSSGTVGGGQSNTDDSTYREG